jgi:hypothetical protein
MRYHPYPQANCLHCSQPLSWPHIEFCDGICQHGYISLRGTPPVSMPVARVDEIARQRAKRIEERPDTAFVASCLRCTFVCSIPTDPDEVAAALDAMAEHLRQKHRDVCRNIVQAGDTLRHMSIRPRAAA